MEEEKEKRLSHHVSHEHPLESTKLSPNENTICFGCKLNILPGKYHYKCKVCPFFLHHVCYNMPERVQHPVNPSHYFTLQSMPSSAAEDSFTCGACGNYVNGFYYSCAKCGDCYHILCFAVPLSVKTPSHPHKLKLEFSPPYDFQCDLCGKPSYSGWLYRCSLCEFDVHLACAITNKGARTYQNLPKQMPNSLDIDRTIPQESKFHELMELLAIGVKGRGENVGQEVLEDQSPFQDQSTPLSESQATPSYLFSDACFSIDFAKSILLDKNLDEASREAYYHKANSPETKGSSQGLTIVSKWIAIDPKQADKVPILAKEPSLNSQDRRTKNGVKVASSTSIGSHIWMESGQENKRTMANGSGRSDVRDQTTKAQNDRSRSSCWSDILVYLTNLRN